MLRRSSPYALLGLLVLAVTFVDVRDESLVVVLPSTLAECLIFVAAAATVLARRRPSVALPVLAVVANLPFWIPMRGPGYHLALMIGLYLLVAHRPSERALPLVAAVLATHVTLMAWDLDWRWSSSYVLAAALSIAFPAALGLAARASQRSREADARQLLTEDRLRTARDLHDSVAHQIAVMNLNAGVASRALRERPAEAEAALVTVREAGRAVITSISNLLTGLRDGTGDAGSQHDVDDLRRLIEEFRTLSPGLTVSYDGPDATTSRPVSPVLYAVVREALTNAYKHGRHDAPVTVRVRLDATSSEVSVANVPAAEDEALVEGFGLRGMRERVVDAGGALDVVRVGDRFVLAAEVPERGAVA